MRALCKITIPCLISIAEDFEKTVGFVFGFFCNLDKQAFKTGH